MKIKKIVVSLFLVLCLGGAIFLLRNVNNKAEDNGNVSINVIDINQNLIKSQSIDFSEGDTLRKILTAHFENVKTEFNGFSYILLEIETIKTNFTSSYIKIMVDDVYSSKGIDGIVLKDQMKIDLIEDRVNL